MELARYTLWKRKMTSKLCSCPSRNCEWHHPMNIHTTETDMDTLINTPWPEDKSWLDFQKEMHTIPQSEVQRYIEGVSKWAWSPNSIKKFFI
jgi:hypothetical protein